MKQQVLSRILLLISFLILICEINSQTNDVQINKTNRILKVLRSKRESLPSVQDINSNETHVGLSTESTTASPISTSSTTFGSLYPSEPITSEPNLPLNPLPVIAPFPPRPSNYNPPPYVSFIAPSANQLRNRGKPLIQVSEIKNTVNEDGSFEFVRQFDDGTSEKRRGYFKEVDGNNFLIIEGEYSKRLLNGDTLHVAYVSDEKGYIYQSKIEKFLSVSYTGFAPAHPASAFAGAFNPKLAASILG